MEKCYRKNPIHFSEMSHPHCNYLYSYYVWLYHYPSLITVISISVEELLVDQLDGTIEIPEVLHFACNDRSQLLDQLKVLQMILRRERDKNKNNQLSVTDSSSSKTQSSSIAISSSTTKDVLKEKVERHKKVTTQRRQDKLKQMDIEAEALSRALTNEECESSESIKVSEIENKFMNLKLNFKLWKINAKISLLDKEEKSGGIRSRFFCYEENETDEYRK